MLLDVRSLRYRYPQAAAPVLHGLDFGVEEGEVFGFLGPNGSGKTTTQKLLTRILHGYEGEVSVFDRDLRRHAGDFYNQIGVCFEFPEHAVSIRQLIREKAREGTTVFLTTHDIGRRRPSP